eukprot:403371047
MKNIVDVQNPGGTKEENFNRNDLINISPAGLAAQNSTTQVRNPEFGGQHEMSIKSIGSSFQVPTQRVQIQDFIQPQQNPVTNEITTNLQQNLEDIDKKRQGDFSARQEFAHEQFHHTEEDSPGIYLGTSNQFRGCEKEIFFD